MNSNQIRSKNLNIIKIDESNIKFRKRWDKDKRNTFKKLSGKMKRGTVDEYYNLDAPDKTGRVLAKGFEEETILKSNESHNAIKMFYSRKNNYFKRKKTFLGKNIGIKTFVIIILLLSIPKGQILFNKNSITPKIFWKNINYTKVHIALNIDNKYIYPSIVFMTSLLENRNYNTFYEMYILISPNLKVDYKDKINVLINKYGDKVLNVSYINMGNDFNSALSGPYISTAAYYRIALPSLLPNNIEKIIYCDADVLAFKDLTKMYNLKLKDNIYMMGALDFASMTDELHQIGLSSDRYMNSGILLMNLKSMRINGVEKKIREFINKFFLNHHDQTAINGVCLNNWDILPITYSSFDYDNYTEIIHYNNEQDKKYRYNRSELNNAFYNPTLIHFAGYVKPWHKECTKSKRYIWWYYAKKSGFYEEILNKYQFNKAQVERELKAISDWSSLIKRI